MVDVTPEVCCETAADQVADVAGQSREWVDGMLIHRQGSLQDSNMTAIGLHRMVKSGEAYQVSARHGLVPVEHHGEALDLELEAISHAHNNPPEHVVISAIWDTGVVVDGGQENVLGDNVVFQIQTQATEIAIPVLEATPLHLGYYGAVLVDEGAVVRFPNQAYPIWKLSLGQRYIDGFIMTPQGQGFYLEYHHDRPHWHQPLTEDSGGYYILAKEVGSDADGHTQYHVTGFHIPYGKAVYTRQGAIHCDAALTGQNWLVGYTDSEDFSTALVRNANGDWVKLSASALRPDRGWHP
ncbi:MAG: hypothetical protein ETSY1_36000 [Candidatus Entotheonella factor]|uniref:Uncharacterized protein n=1 Tax=Entotheonella factor TaxID=1429438 RepID=W4L7X2_ENTF1|nr:hypothetical protein [Candidatus Entotheonella palauensis]ETW94173.1 MAG: hypothetical protein ETSY1_36000 [Candidatus Entotheonella factor]